MEKLSKNILGRLERDYRAEFGHTLRLLDAAGRLEDASDSIAGRLPVLAKARHDALQESVRWGEAYTFFLAPNVVSWVVPVVDGEELLGGFVGGEVLADDDPQDVLSAVNYLVESGCPRARAVKYIESLKLQDQSRTREAAEYLFKTLYEMAPLKPLLLRRNRENAWQQRQIAETIHERKVSSHSAYSLDEERILLSLIRVGDKPGARNELNRMLAAMFLYSPKVALVQARAIEMMGYLVRAAIEDSPMLESLLALHPKWIADILAADDFESLCQVVREALDGFMNHVMLQGYNRSNRQVQNILDYIAVHYREPISLQQIAEEVGLSRFRVAHLVKEVTGKTVIQHVKRMRVQTAQELLLNTDRSYVDIAYELGFSDQSYFIKQFRELTGTTPARYRRRRSV